MNHKMVFTNALTPLMEHLKLKDDQPMPVNKTKTYNLLQLNNLQNLEQEFRSKYTVTEPEGLQIEGSSDGNELDSAKGLSVNSGGARRGHDLMRAHEKLK